MALFPVIFLALLQGLTEFLPISSSAHLILVPKFLQWEDQGMVFDVAVHLGTLLAVVWYFREDLQLMVRDWLRSMVGGEATENSRLAWAVGLATIPVGLAGLLLESLIENHLRSVQVIALATIIFGLLLGWADKVGKRDRDEHSLRGLDVLWIGLAQAMALIPGTSRSGATMTAGLLLGLRREAAARFSFLLSIPVIVLAGGFEARKLIETPEAFDITALLLGTAVSGVSAYLCVVLFLQWLNRHGMWPFVWYRLVLGVVLFAVFGWNQA